MRGCGISVRRSRSPSTASRDVLSYQPTVAFGDSDRVRQQVHRYRLDVSAGDEPVYPFMPRRAADLRVGEFWNIALPNGRYACGRVLALDPERGWDGFLAGLMDWVGDQPPTAEAIAGVSGVLKHGAASVKVVTRHGGCILGWRDLRLDDVEIPLTVSHRSGGTVWVQRGIERIRPATRDEAATMPVAQTLGMRSLQIRAERVFG